MARPASGRAVAQRLRGAEGRFPGWPSQSQRGRTRAVTAPPEGEPRARGNRRFCSAPGAKWLPLQGKALKRPRSGTIVPCCANVPACAVKGANMQKMYGDVAKCCDVAVHCFQLIASFCREGQAPPLRNRRTFSRRTHVSAELRSRHRPLRFSALPALTRRAFAGPCAQ